MRLFEAFNLIYLRELHLLGTGNDKNLPGLVPGLGDWLALFIAGSAKTAAIRATTMQGTANNI